MLNEGVAWNGIETTAWERIIGNWKKTWRGLVWAAMAYFEASDFSEEQIAEFREAFVVFDVNGDGTICVKELQRVFQTLGQTTTISEIRTLLQQWGIDSNGDGVIDFPEFLNLMSSRMGHLDNEDVLMQAFRVFDTDSDGYISSKELRQVMQSMGEQMSKEDVEEMINQADMDGDGMINFEEFVNVLVFKR